ncbi:hypothetical protein OCK74_02145 [Chitinophagaceae bacterium LB-8]|uniref:Leucine-rich repeat domain-containing protein n=1 Tax=Paraflavisolibacter caeni TaxID=2982496 RepID=A0A9X2XT94_9BACT|nr:hypothetical protein [Paraflavisolibacter caeni]MCU7547892.1 hypothetical protein [Paraflavisolibacter caeni]
MKQNIFSLPRILASVMVVSSILLFACSKKSVAPEDLTDNNGNPQETATLKLIPDSVFRVYLKANVCPNAFDNTGKRINITNAEVTNFTGTMNIDTVTCNGQQVASLKGIQYFTNMRKLIVRNSAIDTLVLSATMKLDTLKLLVNKDLQSLDVSGCTSMRFIRISDMPARKLDFSGLPALNYINLIAMSRLNNLNVANTNNLQHLMCYGLSSLKSVNTAACPNLGRLFFESCGAINSIDVTQNPKLYWLFTSFCYSLTSIDLTKNSELKYVGFDDANIDTLDFSKNPKLVSATMMRTPLRNLDLTKNPNLILLYLDGCTQLKNLDIRVQKSWDYWFANNSAATGMDDYYLLYKDARVSPTQTAECTIFGQATRHPTIFAANPQNLFGGLRVPQFLDASGISLATVRINNATKDNYSLVMARRTGGLAITPAQIIVYDDNGNIVCNDYSPEYFKCN